LEKDLFTELQETTKKAIERKKKPEYWDMLVKVMKNSAISGHYSLDIYGKLFNNRAGLYDDSEKMLKDIVNNQDLYYSNLKNNGLDFEVDKEIGPLPADPLGDKVYFTEVHVKIDWSGKNG